MSIVSTIHPKDSTHIPEPPIAKFLFADTRMAWFWLIVRVYVGYQWLTAGLEKLSRSLLGRFTCISTFMACVCIGRPL